MLNLSSKIAHNICIDEYFLRQWRLYPLCGRLSSLLFIQIKNFGYTVKRTHYIFIRNSQNMTIYFYSLGTAMPQQHLNHP